MHHLMQESAGLAEVSFDICTFGYSALVGDHAGQTGWKLGERRT